MPKCAFTCYSLPYVPANLFTSTNFTHLQSCLPAPFHVCSNFSQEFATNANIKPGRVARFLLINRLSVRTPDSCG